MSPANYVMKEKILELLKKIKDVTSENSADRRLPQNVYFLDEDNVLCCGRAVGDSRYPYDEDGMTLWSHSSGYMDACESRLTLFKTATLREEPCIGFWGGKKGKQGYLPVSVLGCCKQLFEDENIKRYTVFSKCCAYYITDAEDLIYAVRASVTGKKQIVYRFVIINKSEYLQEVYAVSYFEPLLRYSEGENFWGRLTRYGKRHKNGNVMVYTHQEIDNIAVIASDISDKKYEVSGTVSKNMFMGDSCRTLTNAQALRSGSFPKTVNAVTTTDMPVAADIARRRLEPHETLEINYVISFTHSEKEANTLIEEKPDTQWIENDLHAREESESKRLDNLDIAFGDFKDFKLNRSVMNRFMKNVQKQVDFCALGKNYAGGMLGVRDVFQQLESALVWNREKAREKIVSSLNYIMITGRSPRQFSIPPRADIIPKFDIREFIDQGLWVISTLYSYLAFTDDYSILDEVCAYYEIIDEKKGIYKKSEHMGDVLEHLLKITEYLIGNIDKATGCLKILYGDWNDAVCGLGRTEGTDAFGSGVSVMATLQLYMCLDMMNRILTHIGRFCENCERYNAVREGIKNGLLKYAIETDSDGNCHIVHGWGDKMSYKVGSVSDSDGKCRYSATSNAFWCISGMLENTPEIGADILKAYEKLDSKYGIKTFEPYFPRNMKGVGRITTLVPGTYENSCTYVHATMFSAMAMFILGEPKKAWEQLYKTAVITHENATMTPFVMPNSYCFNEEFNIDGDSMGDWFTGSGTVFIKNMIKYAFGIQPDLDSIVIAFPSYIPASRASIELSVKGVRVRLTYRNESSGKRRFYVNSAETKAIGGRLTICKNAALNGRINVDIID